MFTQNRYEIPFTTRVNGFFFSVQYIELHSLVTTVQSSSLSLPVHVLARRCFRVIYLDTIHQCQYPSFISPRTSIYRSFIDLFQTLFTDRSLTQILLTFFQIWWTSLDGDLTLVYDWRKHTHMYRKSLIVLLLYIIFIIFNFIKRDDEKFSKIELSYLFYC